MFLSALLWIAAAKGWDAPGESGIYVTAEGYVFTVINPYTIWTDLNGRFHSAYSLSKITDTLFEGPYDVAAIMKPGYDPDTQISAQYDLLNKEAAAIPSGLYGGPLAIPCVPAPKSTAPNASGTVKIVALSSDALHFNWTDAAGSTDYSGTARRVGGSELIDLDGVYADKLGSITISEQGSGDAKTLIGSAMIGSTKYKLSGLRVWGRGTLQLTPVDGSSTVGDGWFEWAPTSSFANKLKPGASAPRPSDRIIVYIRTTSNPIESSSIRSLKRVSD